MHRCLTIALCVLVAGAHAVSAAAQTRATPDATVLASWIALPAPPTREALAVGTIQRALPEWKKDSVGNLVLRRGSGRPRRVVACGLDRVSLVVSRITDDGYLRVHRAGAQRLHPLWDQGHEGQQIEVLTDSGAIPGVVAVANAHFAAQHRGDTAVASADDLWVDMGARSRAEVAAMGIRLLDPVVRRMPAWAFDSWAAGPDAGARAGCAAIASVARAAPSSGETIYLMTTGSVYGWIGLGAALARLGDVDELTIVASGASEAVSTVGSTASSRSVRSMLAIVLRAAKVDSVRTLAPAVRYAGSLVESIYAAEAERLRAQIARAAGIDSAAALRWQAVYPPAPDAAARADSLSELGSLLVRLAELPGPSGHEQLVRDAVRGAMPAWARERVETDSAGNLVLTMGPPGKATVFLAHLDEVGYEVRSIAPDGIVTLAPLGGLVASAWEGQPALIHLDTVSERTPLPGIFVPRDDPQTRRPRQVTAWFGMDSAALAAHGVKAGLGVISPKQALRIGASRFTSRALDDRAGTTALLMALRRVDPGKLNHRVVFAWTTGEEVGLLGATALAARMKTSVERVYSVDTFVSSDTPLESPHFAYAPLGAGPVLRLAENTGMAPLDARARVERIARAAGVPVQIGLTQGGTDGTAFTFWGAPNVGLSWPGRYSHSPAEVLDLTDLRRLVDLIVAAVKG